MVSVLISRVVIVLCGTLYPAYRSYKAVKSKDVKEYVKWMMYWIVFALFSCAEVITDVFASFWLPFYYELKIIFVLWLLSPYTKGASYLYRKLIHPTLSKHEPEIDLYLDQLQRNSYQAMIRLGNQGWNYAKETVANVAVRSQLSLIHQLRKSQSLNDLPEGGIAGPGAARALPYPGRHEGYSRARRQRRPPISDLDPLIDEQEELVQHFVDGAGPADAPYMDEDIEGSEDYDVDYDRSNGVHHSEDGYPQFAVGGGYAHEHRQEGGELVDEEFGFLDDIGEEQGDMVEGNRYEQPSAEPHATNGEVLIDLRRKASPGQSQGIRRRGAAVPTKTRQTREEVLYGTYPRRSGRRTGRAPPP